MECKGKETVPMDGAVSGPEEENESGRAKSNFLARMSHEMRTPLNAIIGMSTIAQTSEDPERIAHCLNKINEASVHLLGMINDVLDMARIESGNLMLSDAEFKPLTMLRKVIEANRFTLDAKKQNLNVDIDPALPETIVADEQRLAQVIDNLLSNAVKFTPPEGTIDFSVKKIKEDEKTCTLGIRVSDTGIGIHGEELEKIFALFEQADGGMARRYGGTGLGLPISASIVHLMGGNIRVDSEPGKGSSFSFEIVVNLGNRKAGENSFSGGRNSAKAAEEERRPNYAGLSILLAEDVEINREIVISLLEDTGITIDCAENGIQAVELYKAAPEKYGLVLMDIHMPEMDGYEATRQIRAFEAGGTRKVPIIAMTANVFKDDVDKCLAAGMTQHLGKPIDYNELIKQLNKFLL